MLRCVQGVDDASGADSRGVGLELSADLRREWQGLVAALREGAHWVVGLDAAPARVRELAAQASALSQALRAHARGCPAPLYPGQPRSGSQPPESDPQALGAWLPFSPVVGRYNPLAPPVSLSREGDRIVGVVRLREAFQGPSGSVHTGVLSAIFDEVLTIATFVDGSPGQMINLTIRHLAAAPILAPLRFESWIDRVERGRAHVLGRCVANDAVVAEAEGEFARPEQSSGWLRRPAP